MRQGLVRGIIYSGIVLELFFMSFTLTEGFSEPQTIATLKSFKFWNRKPSKKYGRVDFILLLFYVIKLFKISYSNLSIFFNRKKNSIKAGFKRNIKMQVIQFLVESLREMQREMKNIKNADLPTIKFGLYDGLFNLFQILILFLAYILRHEPFFKI